MSNNIKAVGARELTENEIYAILPTYKGIKKQVDEMRKAAIIPKVDNADTFLDIPQRLNNIGIMGRRGAGKTSILKTLEKEIGKGNGASLFLPIIVPENMSEKSDLMATILGLFSDQVKIIETQIEKEKSHEIKNFKGYFKDCRFIKENTLRKKYDEVIKQFCFIQGEYRKILIGQYTNQTEYAKRSSELFNADNQFITKFKEFIHELLWAAHQLQKQDDAPLIFIMIDDIDLSTSRCSEVVKVLLSYTCHPNIVTFISGDIDTFEEALTIDFLRQDQAFSDSVSKMDILADKKIKDRKKELAYEYLKKVIPPAYRHNVKRWSLAERASFTMGDNQPTLRELLEEISKDNKAFFTCLDFSQEQPQPQPLLPMYNLFDETSRGLNNVYSVLMNIVEGKREGIRYEDKKRLIDTIISSNSVLNGKREIIESCILFGRKEEETVLKYEKLYNYIMLKKQKEKVLNKRYENVICFQEKDKKEAFQLIILMELVSYLWEVKVEESESWNQLNHLAIDFLQSCPMLYEETVKSNNAIVLNLKKSQELKEMHDLQWDIEDIMLEFMYNTEILAGIQIYNSMKQGGSKTTERETDRIIKCLKEIYQGLYSVCRGKEVLQDYINKEYLNFKEVFAVLQSVEVRSYSGIEVIFEEVISGILEESQIKFNFNGLQNMIVVGIVESLKEIFDQDGHVRGINGIEYDLDSQMVNIFDHIHEVANNVIYQKAWVNLRSKVTELLKTIKNLDEVKIECSMINQAREDFKNIYKGSSWTRADELEWELRENYDYTFEFERNITLDNYKRIYIKCEDLAYNFKVWYGRVEAQALLNKLKEAYFIFDLSNELKQYLHMWALYQQSIDTDYLGRIEEVKEMKQFIRMIEEGQRANKKYIEEHALGILQDETIDIQYIEELFL